MLDPLTNSHSAFVAAAHAAHARLLSDLDLLRSAPTSTRARLWPPLEAALLESLRSEQELLLPDFDLTTPGDAARVRSAQHELRAAIARVTDALEAERDATQPIHQLGRILSRTHALKSDLLYPWADQRLRASKKGEFVQRSRRSETPPLPAHQKSA